MKKRDILLGNFMGGLAWGFGTVVGATVVVAIIYGILRPFGVLPLVGDPVKNAINQVEETQQQIKR